MDELLTDQEQLLTDELIRYIYYSDQVDVSKAIASLKQLEPIRRIKVIDSVFISVSFHQRTREDYILACISSKTIDSSVDRKTFILRLALAINGSGLTKETTDNLVKIKSNADAYEQLTIWQKVEKQLLVLKGLLHETFEVQPVFKLMNNLNDSDLTMLSELITGVISKVKNSEDLGVLTRTTLPKALLEIISKARLSPILKGNESTQEQLSILVLFLTIATSILINRKNGQKIPLADLPSEIGKVLAHTNRPAVSRL